MMLDPLTPVLLFLSGVFAAAVWATLPNMWRRVPLLFWVLTAFIPAIPLALGVLLLVAPDAR